MLFQKIMNVIILIIFIIGCYTCIQLVIKFVKSVMCKLTRTDNEC